MANYLNKYVGTYRVISEYSKSTNNYPRELDGSISDNDLYIVCKYHCKIYAFGGSTLCFYCPSLKHGRNLLHKLQTDNLINLIESIEETDSEVTLSFSDKNFQALFNYFNPSSYGASIRPHSIKNLPTVKYEIPEEDKQIYKNLIASKNISQIELVRLSKGFIKSISTKKKPEQWYNDNMRLQGISGIKYIHSMGLWLKFLDYIKKLEVKRA